MSKVYIIEGNTFHGEDAGYIEHIYEIYADETTAELRALELNETVIKLSDEHKKLNSTSWSNDMDIKYKELNDMLKTIDEMANYDTSYSVKSYELK